ncbi:GNAT family N-acetyltransferase [uncultured Flavobacterium sp.]|uniref:GNAT family N-acetyltransferase n=1 Tax=uncultured Flavobacterium sp. TaxID=165435 RepID=UPI0030CA1AFC
MKIEIRKAQEIEIETLLAFEKGIIKAERNFDPTLKEGEIHYYDLIELIKSPNAEVLVAVSNEKIVGSGYAKIITAKSYLKHNAYAHFGFMYVLPEVRGLGIIQNVLNELMNWTKSKNISEVRLEVYDENTTAKNAYIKSGFKPHILEMRMKI